jgi:HJR/Mrr/RecB family endonuclease
VGLFSSKKNDSEYTERLRQLEQEYAEKQAALEAERELLAEERAKVEKYRQTTKAYRVELRGILDRVRERESEVDLREADLARRERDLKRQEADYRQFVDSLKSAEYNALLTLKRADRKEQEYLSDLMESYEKLKKYPSIANRRNGFKFEEYVAQLLAANDYINVEVTKKAGDYGADVVGEKDGLKYVFQGKYYSRPVGITAIQEAYAAIHQYRADRAAVVTNNVFTKSAKELAAANNIDLWDCSTIAERNVNGDFY